MEGAAVFLMVKVAKENCLFLNLLLKVVAGWTNLRGILKILIRGGYRGKETLWLKMKLVSFKST